MSGMKKEPVHSALKKIGFGDYEAKAYCALLEKAPANGYDIARRSGVPRSKVYESLEKLVHKKAAVRIDTGDKKAQVFAPMDPEVLLNSIKRDMDGAIDLAQQAIEDYKQSEQPLEVFIRIQSSKNLLNQAVELIGQAKKSLHIALWDTDFKFVYPHLLKAMKRKIKMALVMYSRDETLMSEVETLQKSGAGAIHHCQSKMQNLDMLGRQFVLVCDQQQCITGTVLPDGSVDGAYTFNHGLVINAIDLVNHEIYLERILQKVGEPIKEIFGEDLEHLDAYDSPLKKIKA